MFIQLTPLINDLIRLAQPSIVDICLDAHLNLESPLVNKLKSFKPLIEEFKKCNDTDLILTPGTCFCNNKEKKGYRFIGNNSRFYVDLIIESKNGVITDIYDCNKLSTQLYEDAKAQFTFHHELNSRELDIDDLF